MTDHDQDIDEGPVERTHISIREAAARVSVNERTIRRMVEDGRLPALQVGRAIRVAIVDLERLRYQPEAAADRARDRTAEAEVAFTRRRAPRPSEPTGHFSRRARGLEPAETGA